jgi:hypothetical protein
MSTIPKNYHLIFNFLQFIKYINFIFVNFIKPGPN